MYLLIPNAALKTIKYKRHKNNRYIGSFMYPSAVV